MLKCPECGSTKINTGKASDGISVCIDCKCVESTSKFEKMSMSKNNGGDTDYYKTPEGNNTLQDLIEYKDMGFSQGNIFKAAYRLRDQTHSSQERELNKIIWFANRMLTQLKGNK